MHLHGYTLARQAGTEPRLSGGLQETYAQARRRNGQGCVIITLLGGVSPNMTRYAIVSTFFALSPTSPN